MRLEELLVLVHQLDPLGVALGANGAPYGGHLFVSSGSLDPYIGPRVVFVHVAQRRSSCRGWRPAAPLADAFESTIALITIGRRSVGNAIEPRQRAPRRPWDHPSAPSASHRILANKDRSVVVVNERPNAGILAGSFWRPSARTNSPRTLAFA